MWIGEAGGGGEGSSERLSQNEFRDLRKLLLTLYSVLPYFLYRETP